MNTKSLVTFALAGTLTLAPLVGCAGAATNDEPEKEQTEQVETTEQTDPAEAADSSDEQLAGGWTVNTESNPSLSEEEQEIFQKATAEYTGVDLEPVTVLATQVVAGTNYAYLCKATTVTATPSTNWAIAVVYADLEGNASISNVQDIELGNIHEADASADTGEIVGGWEIREPNNSIALTSDATEAFNKASENYDGVSLSPVALLGTQVVAGTNYLVLCQGAPVTQDAKQALYVAQVYADLEGNAEFSQVQALDLLQYV